MALAYICFIVSFFVTLLTAPFWIRKAKSIGLVGKDVHKYREKKVAEAGGIVFMLGALAGILTYIFINTFVVKSEIGLVQMLAIVVTILLAGFVGFVDDMLGWKVGLKQFYKFLFTIPICIPLVVINVGNSFMGIPLLGRIDFGLAFPLLIVPLLIIFCTNVFNMLAGYNGLESGMGFIILTALAFVIWRGGNFWTATIALCLSFSLLAFLFFNRCPSRVFPGDILTYIVGSSIAAVAIVGNVERTAFILLIPYFAQFFLKARGRMKKESFSKVLADGTLKQPYEKLYGLEHVSIYIQNKLRGKATERGVVYSLWALEAVFVLFVLLL